MTAPSGSAIREQILRLFIGAEGALRKEDDQKCRELEGLLALVARIKKGAHVVDAAAGKASVGLVAAALLPIGRLTIIERDERRVAACRTAAARLARDVPVDIRHADVADASAWPDAPDAVVALHACGGAADLVIEGAIRAGARHVFVAPCCYGESVPFRASAMAAVAKMTFAADDLVRRRMTALFVDLERKLRLEAAGYATDIEEFVAPTVTPHNLVFCARRTGSAIRTERANARLRALRDAAG